MKKLTIRTNYNCQMIEITSLIKEVISSSEIKNGICTIFIPHTTCAVTINENADPDVTVDILNKLNKMVPKQDNYKHFEGNSSAHIKASMFGFSENIIIENNRLLLGTWQGIYFCEFDGPRTRNILVSTYVTE